MKILWEVWNNMREKKLWQNFDVWLNYPLKLMVELVYCKLSWFCEGKYQLIFSCWTILHSQTDMHESLLVLKSQPKLHFIQINLQMRIIQTNDTFREENSSTVLKNNKMLEHTVSGEQQGKQSIKNTSALCKATQEFLLNAAASHGLCLFILKISWIFLDSILMQQQQVSHKLDWFKKKWLLIKSTNTGLLKRFMKTKLPTEFK